VTVKGGPVEIRRATESDAPMLATLLAHLGYPADVAELPGRLDRLRATGDDAFVAVSDGAVVGLATVHSRAVLHAPRPVAQLTALVVPPEARGRGIGRELVRWGIEACRDRGAMDVFLSVEGENRGALRLYESLGFRQDVEWPHWTIPVG
jgi:ribosomal protein S18 acetylase RimI-like enzyme